MTTRRHARPVMAVVPLDPGMTQAIARPPRPACAITANLCLTGGLSHTDRIPIRMGDKVARALEQGELCVTVAGYGPHARSAVRYAGSSAAVVTGVATGWSLTRAERPAPSWLSMRVRWPGWDCERRDDPPPLPAHDSKLFFLCRRHAAATEPRSRPRCSDSRHRLIRGPCVTAAVPFGRVSRRQLGRALARHRGPSCQLSPA